MKDSDNALVKKIKSRQDKNSIKNFEGKIGFTLGNDNKPRAQLYEGNNQENLNQLEEEEEKLKFPFLSKLK